MDRPDDDLLAPDVPPEHADPSPTEREADDERADGIEPEEHFGLTPPG